MYEVEFIATDSADWAEAIEFYEVGGPCKQADLIPSDASFDLVIRGRGDVILKASTADGTILRPSSNVISWRFTQPQTRCLNAGNTYQVGLTMSTATGTEQILVGSLSFVEGVVK